MVPPATPARLPGLSGLRGLAALLVVLFHTLPHHSLWAPLATQGSLAVTVFFVLSGYLLAWHYGPEARDGTFRLPTYLLRRGGRLYSVYAAVLLPTAWLAGFSLPYTLYLLTMAHGWTLAHRGDGILQAWSLSCELVFYALLPLALRGRTRHLVRLAIAGLLGALALSALHPHLPQALQPWLWGDAYYALLFSPLGRLPEFLLGVGLATLPATPARLRHGTRLSLLLLVVLVAVETATTLTLGVTGTRALPLELGLQGLRAIAAGVWVWTVAQGTAPWLDGPLFAFLGRISYPLYLVHLGAASEAYRAYFGLDTLPAQLGWIALSLALAWLLHRLVERPVMHWVARRTQSVPVATH